LIQSLEKNLSGVKIGRQKAPTSVVAYADNVTIFLSSVADIQKMKETLLAYEATTGPRINIRKSRVLALGTWDTTRQIMNIPHHKGIKILGFQFTDIVHSTAIATWSSVTARVRATVQETYYRDLSMDRRIQFVHEYLLSKIWYVTQIFPPPPDCMQQINTTISWFIWRGEIFRVPLSTLQHGKTEGGWNLVNAWAKSRALFMYHLQMQNQRVRSITDGWLRFWNLFWAWKSTTS